MTDVVEQIIHYGRKAVGSGLVIGSGGNLSAREPGSGAVWVTASGTWLDELTPEDFSLVGITDGAVLLGHPRPSSELPLHLHPQTSVLLDAMGHAYYVRAVRPTPFVQSGTVALAEAGADAIRDGCNCVILGHHGCSVVADSVELAYKRAANLEEAARATYAALLLGEPVPIRPPEYLEAVRAAEAVP